MDTIPVELTRDGDSGLLISWSNGRRLRYTASKLRAACPCATCREKKSSQDESSPRSLPVISAAEAKPVTIQHMRPVGNYAYNISFSDGHDSGIYTFENLYALGQESGVE